MIHVPRYRSLLFNGDGDIPDVNEFRAGLKLGLMASMGPVLQTFRMGSGDLQLGRTPECVSMLRYFGIRLMWLTSSTRITCVK